MLRFLTITIFVVTLGMAGVLYKIKYDTRSLQLETVQLQQKIAVEQQQLAVLKAEWSILTQPQRIEALAKSIGLKPLSPKQIISFRDLDNLPVNNAVPFAHLKQENTLEYGERRGLAKRTSHEALADHEEFSQMDELIGNVVLTESSEVTNAN